MKEFFASKAREIVSDIKRGFVTADINATGKTSASLREVATITGFTIYADEKIDQVLDGSKPGTVADLSQVELWRKARNVTMSSKAVQSRIQKLGTRLFRGQDPRYPGLKSRRFVIDNVITEERIEDIKNGFATQKRLDYINEILKAVR